MTRLYVEPKRFGTPGLKWDDVKVAAESSEPRVCEMDPSRPGIGQANMSRNISSCFPTLCLPRENSSVLSLFRNEKRTMSAAIEINWMSFFEVDISQGTGVVEDDSRAIHYLLAGR